MAGRAGAAQSGGDQSAYVASSSPIARTVDGGQAEQHGQQVVGIGAGADTNQQRLLVSGSEC